MMPRHSGKELHVLSRTVESISGGTSSMMKGLPHHSVSAAVVNPSTTLPATLRLGTPRLHPAPLLLPQLPRTALPQALLEQPPRRPKAEQRELLLSLPPPTPELLSGLKDPWPVLQLVLWSLLWSCRHGNILTTISTTGHYLHWVWITKFVGYLTGT